MRRALKIAIAVLLLLAAAAAIFAVRAAAWLKGDDSPIKAEVIIVLAGRYERSMHAADLFRAGHAPVVVLSEAAPESVWQQLDALGIRTPTALEIHRSVLRAKGVPADRIEILGSPFLSTVDEAGRIAGARLAALGERAGPRHLPGLEPGARRCARRCLDRLRRFAGRPPYWTLAE